MTAEQQLNHEISATLKLLRLPFIQRAQKVAVFLTNDGELGTGWLIAKLWQTPKKLYLPVLTKFNRHPMQFANFHSSSIMQKNHFNIPEPLVNKGQLLHGKELDLVIMPLTCFDKYGNRIGMGGGFYDRSFAFKRFTRHARPKLIGWAHECQQVEHINSEKWDIPLDAIITEKNVYQFNNNDSLIM